MADYKTRQQVQDEIIKAIVAYDEHIATDVGQPLRRVIIDPVSEAIESAYIQDYKTRMSFDLDNLSGEALDNFLENFGFRRKIATRAYGNLLFSRTTAADNVYVLPRGVRACTVDGTYFRTTVNAIIGLGETSVLVPAEAEVAGSSGNVSSGEIKLLTTGIAGMTSVTNPDPFSGGEDEESDSAVKIRFRNEIFRNIAGTYDQYHGICSEFGGVSKVTAIGPASKAQELIHFVVINESENITGGVLLFDNIYSKSVFVENMGRDTFFTAQSNWELKEGRPETEFKPYIEVKSGSDLEDYLNTNPYAWVTYEFNAAQSRGPGCVDIYIVGRELSTATDVFTFSGSSEKYYFTKNPVVSIITVVDDSQTYGTDDYSFVRDVSNYCKSPSAQDYIIFDGISTPTNGDRFQVTYTYNSLVTDIQDELRTRKQVTANALVHEGVQVVIDIQAKIMLGGYEVNVPKETVDKQIVEKLTDYFASLPFGASIQFSDLEYVIHQIAGVDNVEIISITATPEDQFDSITQINGTFTEDIVLDGNQYASLGTVTTSVRSYSTWAED